MGTRPESNTVILTAMPLIEHLKKGNFAERRLPLLTCNWQSIEFVSPVQVPEPPATQGAPGHLKVHNPDGRRVKSNV
jgi:hypothetical protein